MNQFAKTFNDTPYGQILVMVDANDNGDPAVRFSIDGSPFGMGICSTQVSFPDNDKGGPDARKFFEKVDQERAEYWVCSLHSDLKKLTGGDA